jgi:hypothetical protein
VPSLTIWSRLEPRCRSADLSAALEARTHDPFWMLSRQWQLGELSGDDAGSPIIATVTSSEVVLNRFAGADGSTPAAIPPGIPLEAWIEGETVRPAAATVDYRQSADAGLYFVRLLLAGNLAQYAPAYVSQYAITAPSAALAATLDAPALAMAAVVAGRVPDGIQLAADLRAAQPGLPVAPAIAAGDQAAAQGAANAFLAWYDALYDAPTAPVAVPSNWVNERMEYHFTIDSAATDTPCAFVADQYTGDPLDWPSFDSVTAPLGPVTAAPAAMTRTLIPAPVNFKGGPTRRYWQLEDADVDIGAIDAGPADLARLMLREFALIYGNDWFVIPLPVTVGTVVSITSLVVTDTFGVTQTIPHYSVIDEGVPWRMFAINGDELDHRLMLPPVLAEGLASDPQERVLLVRDDANSIAWGVEQLIAGASGAVIDRASATAVAAPPAKPPSSGTGLTYQLGTSAPEFYIPFLATQIDSNQQRMQRAAFLQTDGTRAPILPQGRLLAPDVPMFQEEFIREGVCIERMYRLARWTDGSTHLWLARRKTTGAAAGSSGLLFDRATTTTE